MLIQIWDETIPGTPSLAHAVMVESEKTTAREVLRARIQQEVDRYNEHLSDVFQGLVQPEESERLLNGYRLRAKRPLEADKQFRLACASFETNGFLLLVDDRQVTDLDAPILLHQESEVKFVKLVPLVGG